MRLTLGRALVVCLRWLVALSAPIVIILLSARIMVGAWYPRYEYSKPDFPPDPYGFTQAHRIDLATASIEYLNRPEPPEEAIALLAALRLPGTGGPLFTAGELQHMMDVKRLTDALWRVLGAAAVVAAGGLAVLLARRGTRADGAAALFAGGLLTSGLLAGLILFILTAWRTFFIAFHDVFFAAGTWAFDWRDSLIRIFPDRFWSDAGILLVGGALVAALAVTAAGFALGRWARRSAAVRGAD